MARLPIPQPTVPLIDVRTGLVDPDWYRFLQSWSSLMALPNFANDAAAATGGVRVNDFYRNGSVVQIRVT